MKKHGDSIDAAILDRIRSGAQDRVWIPADFLDLGSRAAVDKALSRNCKTGLLRRAGRGLYHIPKHHPILGSLVPPDAQLHDAICRSDGSKIYSTGAHAANVLGLSDQVPTRPMLLTTGNSRRIRRGRGTLILKHIAPRFVSAKHHKSTLAILALRSIGKRSVDDDVIARLRRNLSSADRAALMDDLASAPAWIADIFRKVATDPA
jgi:hypothetical protein